MNDPRTPRFDVWQSDADQLWYWHIVGGNGEIMGRSSEGYGTEEHAEEGLASVRSAVRQVLEAEDTDNPSESDPEPIEGGPGGVDPEPAEPDGTDDAPAEETEQAAQDAAEPESTPRQSPDA